METDRDVLRYYNEGHEHDRLTARPSLELIRTQVLLRRFLPPAPASVLDVGGGGGVYSQWLSGLGYQVTLIDPVALHVEQAGALAGFTARLGDARALEEADESCDAVLLLGPLYHLTERADRVRALAEAARVVRPGGVVVAVGISRYATLFDGYFRGYLERPGFVPVLTTTLESGQHHNPPADPGLFTTAFFHRADELAAEVTDAGLELTAVLPVEGPLHWAPGIAQRLADPEQLALVLDTLTVLEQDPAATAATSHLLAAATRPPR